MCDAERRNDVAFLYATSALRHFKNERGEHMEKDIKNL